MPANKKQHYVPKFYLKRWSKSGKNIGLLNVPSSRLVLNASLNNQCYKDYMYGKQLGFEKNLSSLETGFSQLFALIARAELMPPPWSDDHQMLILASLLQLGRTHYASEETNEMHDKLIKAAYREHIKQTEGIDLDDFIVRMQAPANFNVSMLFKIYPMAMDLHYKLLKNETTKDFITSDTPVNKVNPLLSFNRAGGITGLASKGLVVLYPLTPQLCMIFFDGGAYRVGADKEITLSVTHESDVEQINILQAASCFENVYFKTDNFGSERLIKNSRQHRRKEKAHVRQFPEVDEGHGRRSRIIMQHAEDIRFVPKLSFMSYRKAAKQWKAQERKQRLIRAHYPRNESYIAACERFNALVDEGRYTVTDFLEYLNDIDSR